MELITFLVGIFLKIEDCEGGFSNMQCHIFV